MPDLITNSTGFEETLDKLAKEIEKKMSFGSVAGLLGEAAIKAIGDHVLNLFIEILFGKQKTMLDYLNEAKQEIIAHIRDMGNDILNKIEEKFDEEARNNALAGIMTINDNLQENTNIGSTVLLNNAYNLSKEVLHSSEVDLDEFGINVSLFALIQNVAIAKQLSFLDPKNIEDTIKKDNWRSGIRNGLKSRIIGSRMIAEKRFDKLKLRASSRVTIESFGFSNGGGSL